MALVRSKLDDARSPWEAEGFVSVGVGSGLAVFIVQASPKPPDAETPTPPGHVGSFTLSPAAPFTVPPATPLVMGWPKADCEPACSRSWLESNMETAVLRPVPVDDQVHSFWDQRGMLSVALPPVLVATGAMVTGALATVLLLVPQICPVPAARLTS